MFLSNASVRRPVAMGCLIIALTLLGINSYRKMPIEFMPKVDVPYITIVTIYPGASPTEIETDIAKKIEDAIGSIDGLKHLSSSCMEDSCLNLLEFQMNVDVDVAAVDVREKLDLIQADLPADAERPRVLKYDINAQPIIDLALTGDAPLDALYDYADNELSDRFSTISGVAEVQVIGGAEREVHVLLDRETLAARGLSSLDVVKAIGEGIRTIPSGRVRQGGTEYSVKFDAEYDDVDAIGALEVANENGSRCYLGDLGQIVMTNDEQRQAAFIDGRPGIALRVVKKADANAVAVVRDVREAFDEFKPLLPGGMELVWVADDGAFIESSAKDTNSNIIQGIVLTAAILFVFLLNFRTTLIVAVTMPLTVVVSLFFLQILGFTLNISTLLALGLSVGILVTNSIVVLESVVKRLATSGDPKEAARTGSSAVGIAVLGSAGTNVVVLFPIAMMGGMIALFLRPFAWSMVIVTVVSLFISFTLTPILCAVFLKVRPKDASHWHPLRRAEAAWDRYFDWQAERYTALLRVFGRHRWLAIPFLCITVLIFVHSLFLAGKLGFGFFREPDRARIFVKLEYPTRYSLAETEARVREVENRLRGLPGLRHLFTTIGKVEGVIGQASEGVYLAQILLLFPDKTERAESSDGLLEQTRTLLADYTDCIVTASVPAAVGGQNYPVELEITGQDLDMLDRLALRIRDFAVAMTGFVDTDTTVRAGKPELRVRPKRAVLSDLGFPASTLGMALRANLAGIEAGIFKQGARSYDIRVKFAERKGKDQVAEFLFPGAPGRPMLLTNIADVEETHAPVQITRKDKNRAAKILSQLMPNKPLGLAVNELSAAINEKGQLPAAYRYRFAGVYEMMSESIDEFLEAGILAIVLTYLLLAATLESFKQPFIILATIPLGLIGVVWALYLTSEAITPFVLLGGVMLIGIVVNNAILIMDRVNQLHAEGCSPHEAMARAAGEELRPILMITLAAILGMIPLAFGRGLGSEMRNAIGIASIGGIAMSAVLTLIVIPLLYEMFTRHRPLVDSSSSDAARD